jgi:pimeloyl-ACP methyl ester carboxylesterase
VLILHGVCLDHRHMVETCEPVFADLPGWRRIYVDMPGHGQSGPGDGIETQEDLLKAVLAFATETFPGERFALIGLSRGSYIARGFAYLRPDLVEGMALIVPGGSPTAPPGRLPAHVTLARDPGLRAGLGKAEAERFDGLVVQTRAILDKARRTIDPAIPLHDAAMFERVWHSFDFPFDLTAPEAVFDKPCLIIAGRQDSWSGYLDAIDALPAYPRATLAVLDTAGHHLAWERPDLFEALMRDWLQRLAPASG